MNKRSANNITRDKSSNGKSAVQQVEQTEQTEQTAKIALDASDHQKLTDAFNQSTDDLAEKASKSVAEQLAEIKLAREILAQEKEQVRLRKEQEKAELKAKRDLEKALAELASERDALENLKNSSVDIDDDSENDEYSAAFAKENYKVSADNQDKFFIDALKACGNSVDRIGILREYWKAHSAEFRAITKEKQQKAIMRRTVNRLIDRDIVVKDGMKLTLDTNALAVYLAKKAEKIESK